MKTSAAILVETGHPLELVELDIPLLKSGQVLVEIAYSGVCHTQLLEARGHRGADRWLPHCLGHEGTGRVLEIGPAVTCVKPGQPVILSWIRGAGADGGGVSYRCGERTVNAGLITTFQRYAVVSENRLTPVVAGLDLKQGVILGCAFPTGVGAVINVARTQPGEAVAVFGAGGVGLCAVIGATICGAYPIIAVDINSAKLTMARQLGASHAIDPSVVDDVEGAVREAAGGSLDIAIEATGLPSVMETALRLVRPQGGRAVIIGNARHGEQLSFDPGQLNQGKRLLGTWGGDSVPERDYPRYGRLLAAGRITVEPLLGLLYSLAETNAALDDLEAGTAFRPVIDMTRTEGQG